MRDMVMAGLVVLMIGLCLRNAFAAYMFWGWAGLAALQTFMYGFMIEFQFVQLFAVVALLVLVLGRGGDTQLLRGGGNAVVVVFVLFGLHALVAATFSYPGIPRNWEICLDLLKTLLFCLLMPLLVTNRLRVHAMMLMLALGFSLHSVTEGLKFLASGGAHVSDGNARFGDRNHFAVLVVMTIPLLLYLYNYSRNWVLRWVVLACAGISAVAVISTYSRAGLVTLLAMGLWLLLRGRRKIFSLVLVAITAVVVVSIAPENWVQRMETIKSATEDQSFVGRLQGWQRSSAIAVANPINGGGFRAVQTLSVFEQFRNDRGFLGFIDTPDQPHPVAAHSIYFEVLGDTGFIGLVLFLLIMFSPFVMLSRVKRLAKQIGPSALWASDLASMLTLSMVAYLVGGASISVAYFELPYVLAMLAFVLYRVLRLQAQAAGAAPAVPSAALPGAPRPGPARPLAR